MAKGYIFDFNGTLFWDTDFHDEAWLIFSNKYSLNITKKYLREQLHGKVNREIFKFFFGEDLTDADAQRFSLEKEQIYRNIVNNLRNDLQLAPGATGVMDKLRKNNAPRAIATSSPKINVDFYIELFDLHKWFPKDCIIYDDGSFRGKPAPDIFLIAARQLNLDPADCVVVEDSITGIKSALAAGIGKIYLVSSGNHLAWDHSDNKVEVIGDFTQFQLP